MQASCGRSQIALCAHLPQSGRGIRTGVWEDLENTGGSWEMARARWWKTQRLASHWFPGLHSGLCRREKQGVPECLPTFSLSSISNLLAGLMAGIKQLVAICGVESTSSPCCRHLGSYCQLSMWASWSPLQRPDGRAMEAGRTQGMWLVALEGRCVTRGQRKGLGPCGGYREPEISLGVLGFIDKRI